MKYKWNPRKEKSKQHLCDDNWMSLCRVENGSTKQDKLSDTPDPDRKVCSICEHLLGKPRRRHVRHKNNKKWSSGNERHDLFLRTREWKEVRYMALRHSEGRCSACGRGYKDNVTLNVDHIKPRHKYPELALTLSNLQVLCADCNHGKGGWDETDWREPDVRELMGEKA